MLSSRPLRPMAPEEREVYEQDGVVCLMAIFPLEWLAFLADAIEEAMASPGPDADEYTRKGGSGPFFGDLELAVATPQVSLPPLPHFVSQTGAPEGAVRSRRDTRPRGRTPRC